MNIIKQIDNITITYNNLSKINDIASIIDKTKEEVDNDIINREAFMQTLLSQFRELFEAITDKIITNCKPEYADFDCYFYPNLSFKRVIQPYTLKMQLEPVGQYSHIMHILMDQHAQFSSYEKARYVIGQLIDECTYFTDEKTKIDEQSKLLNIVLEFYEVNND